MPFPSLCSCTKLAKPVYHVKCFTETVPWLELRWSLFYCFFHHAIFMNSCMFASEDQDAKAQVWLISSMKTSWLRLEWRLNTEWLHVLLDLHHAYCGFEQTCTHHQIQMLQIFWFWARNYVGVQFSDLAQIGRNQKRVAGGIVLPGGFFVST